MATARLTTPPVTPPATFTSPHARLVVFDGGEVVAAFMDGRFTTSDPRVLAVLRNLPLCHEVTP